MKKRGSFGNDICAYIEHEIKETITPVDSDGILLATVSGGADSVAMLCSLIRLRRKVVAAHCNFHLRGEESNRDQNFVENLCRELGVELRVKHFDVGAYRHKHGGSMEMACRELRYEWFGNLYRELGCARIVTAHHADDNVETMLLNLLRGCGIEGAKGMVADTGVIMRPLLSVHRNEIEEYLRCLGKNWIVDSTNLDCEPNRNFIRLEVLPLLEKRFTGARKRLATSQRHLQGAFSVYSDWRKHIAGQEMLELKTLIESSDSTTLLHEWLGDYGFTSAQNCEMLREAKRPHGHSRVWTAVNGDWHVIMAKERLCRVPATMPGIKISEERCNVDADLLNSIRMKRNAFVVLFPKPLSAYRMRTPRAGDRMIIGKKSSKKISDLLKEAEIPLPHRNQYPLLVDKTTDEPLWLPGIRRAATEYAESDSSEGFIFSATF